jgi:REP-associated tyrosine transposase
MLSVSPAPIYAVTASPVILASSLEATWYPIMRRARVVIPGVAHHVTQRGNRRGDVFLEAEDRHLYLELLREYSRRDRLRIWAYALMTNHSHLVAVPESDSSLCDALRYTHSAYASLFNRKYGFGGHLWQARFYSCVLDDEHLEHAVRYVECNPVRAGVVDRAEDYPWSSAGPHVLGIQDRYLDPGLPFIAAIRDWSGWLAGQIDDNIVCAIREATTTGRACGSEELLRRLEAHSGCCLRPQKRGRKPRPTEITDVANELLPFS